jgi:hypothetical protein
MPLPHDVFMEMASIIDSEDTADCTGYRTNRSSDHCTDRTRVSLALRGTFLRAAYRALRVSC